MDKLSYSKEFILDTYNKNKRTPTFVDLSNVAYRSAFVFTPDKFITKQGIPNGGLFGVCQNIKTLVSTGYEVYLCRDLPVKWRAEVDSNYKANREREDGGISIHKILNEAINPLICKLDNVHVISNQGYEADDMMFSGAKYCSKNNIKSYILTTDKDLCQSLDENITIAHKFTLAGPQEVVTFGSEYYKKNFGDILPECLPLYRAFKGDASDNLEAPIKRFPKDLLIELCNEYKELGCGSNIANLIKSHICSKSSHSKWMDMLSKDRDTFIKLMNNFIIMKLDEVPINIEDEALVDDAFNIITEKYELWGFRKFVNNFNEGGI